MDPWDQYATSAEKGMLTGRNGLCQHPNSAIMDTIRSLAKVVVIVVALTFIV